jgi:hypothetical protein
MQEAVKGVQNALEEVRIDTKETQERKDQLSADLHR